MKEEIEKALNELEINSIRELLKTDLNYQVLGQKMKVKEPRQEVQTQFYALKEKRKDLVYVLNNIRDLRKQNELGKLDLTKLI